MNRWLAVRLEFVGAMIIFIVASLAILTVRTTYVDAGLVGLVISYALNTTSSLVRKIKCVRVSYLILDLELGRPLCE